MSLNVTIPFGAAAATQRTPPASVQLASDPVSKSAAPNDALVAIGPLASDEGSNAYSFPPPATSTASFSFHVNTRGDVLKLTPATFADARCLSVFGSSAKTELDSAADPAAVAI